MKTLTIIVASLFVAGSTASAFAQAAGPKTGAPPQGAGQGQKGPGQKGPGKIGDRAKAQHKLLAQLNLTDKQMAEIKAIDQKFMEQMKALKDRIGGNKDNISPADRQKLRELMEARQRAILEVLTPAQRAKYEQLLREMREKARKDKGGKDNGGVPPPSA